MRQSHRRSPGRWRGLLLCMGGLLAGLSACAPIRGYSGPERPKEQIAIVSFAAGNITRAIVQGQEFGTTGISLLPGTYAFEMAVSHGQPPYHCHPYTTLDTYGFDQCQKTRADDLRKGKKRPRECSLTAYTQQRQTCWRDYRDAHCTVTLILEPGMAYELEVPPSIVEPPRALAATLVDGQRLRLPTHGACTVVGTRTEQEDTAW